MGPDWAVMQDLTHSYYILKHVADYEKDEEISGYASNIAGLILQMIYRIAKKQGYEELPYPAMPRWQHPDGRCLYLP